MTSDSACLCSWHFFLIFILKFLFSSLHHNLLCIQTTCVQCHPAFDIKISLVLFYFTQMPDDFLSIQLIGLPLQPCVCNFWPTWIRKKTKKKRNFVPVKFVAVYMAKDISRPVEMP